MKKGFSLIEILVVIVVIAVITAIGVVSYTSINKNARNAKRRSDVEQIRSALELYRADLGYYPSVNGGVMQSASRLSGVMITYMPAIPTDPKELEYLYQETDLKSGHYYGYCLAASMEPIGTIDSTCVGSLGGYNYGRRNP